MRDATNAAATRAAPSASTIGELKIGALPGGGSPQDYAAFMRDESARWGEVVRKNNIKLEQ